MLGEKEVLLGYREGDRVRFLSIAKKFKRPNSTSEKESDNERIRTRLPLMKKVLKKTRGEELSRKAKDYHIR